MPDIPWEIHPLDYRFALTKLDDEFATFGGEFGHTSIPRSDWENQGRPIEVLVRVEPGTWPPP